MRNVGKWVLNALAGGALFKYAQKIFEEFPSHNPFEFKNGVVMFDTNILSELIFLLFDGLLILPVLYFLCKVIIPLIKKKIQQWVAELRKKTDKKIEELIKKYFPR